ncbi:hypothetical protein CYY_009079 [Polysphondylium violaceum]|uniref:Uncharacterized protein n=1 Tax=Polysphondylium violaceum TaxID=133409 RepID=A0A8J4PPH7_9MYCE|nr:hypothetical protein CYY_009079 [Polysphondylium violaceum]
MSTTTDTNNTTATTRKCGNNGCGKEFTEETVDQCTYHPGNPLFRDGLKYWSCCPSKKVIDFEDFLAIAGCSAGRHQVKEVTEKKTAPVSTKDDDKFVPKPIVSKPSADGSNTTKPKSSGPVGSAKHEPIQLPEYVEENDPEDAVITAGTQCTRNGCKAVYKDESSKTEQCVYHYREPVFHEASKWWACCPKYKHAIFEEFLKVKGCKTGRHRFVPSKKADNFVECRHDWYQSFDAIIFTIYAKGVDKDQSKIEFLDNMNISVDLKLANDKVFKKVYQLAGTLNIADSKIDIMKTKVEMKLVKDPQEPWSKLESSELDLYRYQV